MQGSNAFDIGEEGNRTTISCLFFCFCCIQTVFFFKLTHTKRYISNQKSTAPTQRNICCAAIYSTITKRFACFTFDEIVQFVKKKMKSVSLEKACAIIGISLVIVFEFSLIENIETEFNTDFRFFKKPKKKTSNMLRLVRVEHVGKRDRERKCGSKVILYLKVVHKKRKHGMWLFRWYFWMHSLSRQLFIYN